MVEANKNIWKTFQEEGIEEVASKDDSIREAIGRIEGQ